VSDKEPTPAVAYLRRSRKLRKAERERLEREGRPDSESIESQRDAVKKFAADHGLDLVGEYIDEGKSGGVAKGRKGWLDMRAAAGGGYKAVVVWKLDRFSRMDSDEFWFEAREFIKNGVRLVSVMEGDLDWFTGEGRMMLNLRIFAASKYLADHASNVCRGMADAVRDGYAVGGAAYGYVTEAQTPDERRKHSTLKIDPDRADVVRRIFRWYVFDGWTVGQIVRKLNDDKIPSARSPRWQVNSVLNVLRNRAYLGGRAVWNRKAQGRYAEVKDGAPRLIPHDEPKGGARFRPAEDWLEAGADHEAIIDAHTFELAQRRLEERYRPRGERTEPPYFLAGLVRCAACGKRMAGKTPGRVGRGRVASECRSYICDDAGCRCRRVREQAVILALADHADRVLTAAADRAAVVRLLRGVVAAAPASAERDRVELAALDAKIANAEEAFLEAPAASRARMSAKIAGWNRDRAALAERVRAAEQAAAAAAEAEQAADEVSRAAAALRRTLLFKAWIGSPRYAAAFKMLFERVDVRFADPPAPAADGRARKSDRRRTSYVAGFKVTLRPEALTPRGLVALASESAAPKSDARAGRFQGGWTGPGSCCAGG
jgi:DNA invertase Pin-like site-specific DNA recombinase